MTSYLTILTMPRDTSANVIIIVIPAERGNCSSATGFVDIPADMSPAPRERLLYDPHPLSPPVSIGSATAIISDSAGIVHNSPFLFLTWPSSACLCTCLFTSKRPFTSSSITSSTIETRTTVQLSTMLGTASWDAAPLRSLHQHRGVCLSFARFCFH